MKTWYVDFSGYCEIEAENEFEAEEKFWNFINSDKALPQNIYDFDGIEEKKDCLNRIERELNDFVKCCSGIAHGPHDSSLV